MLFCLPTAPSSGEPALPCSLCLLGLSVSASHPIPTHRHGNTTHAWPVILPPTPGDSQAAFSVTGILSCLLLVVLS